MKRWFLILLIFPLFANAAYQRNQARPVNEVVFGQVETVRYISQQDIVHSKANGWETLLGAVVGGLIGNQFGDGHGREVATAIGAVAGAGIARSNANQTYHVEYRLVEILIKTSEGKLIDVIQDVDSQMLFSSGDRVRILYFDDGVRVDKEM
ncbi:glycine zipper 2TM domain-containing protein [Vibrio fluvialis]|jgi:outer membrane lipoprotein SlyB|uniref:Outer membrane lipoprotein n=1 Tax=Vibrio fluvialis PG41 TaxID=1336752 RepID=S7I2J9_VIBFL|nr:MULTISPECIES: glycine zipper 2TM domain-containing protein [Vibrio]TNF12839.1 MAG: glycine zipper 2TM domain-containing protein [Vibrionaceae bacterium]HDM8032723.1 glycine zipper 2TM domain-containing protein [Vibrio fluvialis clinical-1]EKO3372335.1 glycine zipper 2TM domain-containing protein [Vibrio fluvialis]EKO3374984.1 glycine zipper 2TM domain-containing protein [Vibrio fluvialis]EKO3380997.1 glycine zipper 2TM domain-containing protein [Vibrio fluvialis]